MSILRELQHRFRPALADLADDPKELEALLDLLRRSQEARFGDYQANLAMPLGKRLGRQPREVAAEIVARLDVDDLCLPPEIAGPGFINLKVRDDWLAGRLAEMVADDRLGIAPVESPRTYVIDYSAPNVAKPMHVGHIRSTVIGDALYRTLQFLGHRTVSDNHLGDWGTQFGMIIYGYKHFLDRQAYGQNPVEELARLYRLVRQLMDYQEARIEALRNNEEFARQVSEVKKLENLVKDKPDKNTQKRLDREKAKLFQLGLERGNIQAKLDAVARHTKLKQLADRHEKIPSAVLSETARLHAGDEENLRLWQEFMPFCQEEINAMYRRLGVRFDHTLGESFYHDRLERIVKELQERGAARESEGAIIVRKNVNGYDVTEVVVKKDGGFTYGTTDLATMRYRMDTWHPYAILYVVDYRQKVHFEWLFKTAAEDMGHDDVKLIHVSFGTVLGEDGRPFKTRAGDTVGLESLVDEAVRRARQVVDANDDAKPGGPELSEDERKRVAETVGIGALKYADLSQNRTSDYVFSYDKMLAMNGNTGTYMQYAYARVRNIFAKGNVDIHGLRASGAPILLGTPAERALGLELLRFAEALDLVVADYRPNQLTGYLFELANRYSTFYEECPVLKAESDAVRSSRLLLCDLTARTIGKGLELLGIKVVDKM